MRAVIDACHICASLKHVPDCLSKQSTGDPPVGVGVSSAADVPKRNRQLILLLRETVTSYTSTAFIDDEKYVTLCNTLIRLCCDIRPTEGPPAIVRVDSAPGFMAQKKDCTLTQFHICIEIGRVKNVNKNLVAEQAIQELQHGLQQQDSTGGSVTSLTLALATNRLNSRIRSRGLSKCGFNVITYPTNNYRCLIAI